MRLTYDLHIHSALSPCGDEDMTPNNIVNMAYIKGLDIISVTDHNTVQNVEVIMKVAKKRDILVIPGIEVTTKEEVHILCYFRNTEDSKEFQDFIYRGLPNIKNNEKLFGRQLLMDENDNIIGKVDKFLLNSTKYTIKEINDLVNRLNGALVPAHVDKKSYSILANLGFIPNELNIKTVEVSSNYFSLSTKILNSLNGYNILKNSDAHYLGDINEPVMFLDLEKKDINSLIEYLNKSWRNKG
ncbi:phosphoesterase [Caloranaerobacter sp. TR13]|uniref:PHP domain-containing protein n=1 Tax=Caloranaerobacter sp. TR13 TaxID=1302151 RepID=UPI0006D4487D|nr:PHP domain-containing protein [Caloranaerobacter sp. TR13]KPU27839.1 phosphoesterase [Caloranaerobacter sp. TR13]